MAAPQHSPLGKTFGHRRSQSQGGAAPPSTDGLLLRDARLRQWHPVVAKLTGTTLQLIRTEQNIVEQHPLTDAKVDIIIESGRECVRVILPEGERLVLHHGSDAERRRLHTELGTACAGWVQRSPAPSNAPVPVMPVQLPPPPIVPVGPSSPRMTIAHNNIPPPIAIPRPPSHAPPPPPSQQADTAATRLPVVVDTSSRASHAGVRALPATPPTTNAKQRPTSPPHLMPVTRPAPPTQPSSPPSTSPFQRPTSPQSRQQQLSPRFVSAYNAPLPPPISPTRSTSHYGDTSPRRDLPPPPPSVANTVRSTVHHEGSNIVRELPSAPPSILPRSSSPLPRPSSPQPLARINAPLPPPLVLPVTSAAPPAQLSPVRSSVSPRPAAAGSPDVEGEEEEWNKKISAEERAAELQSSATEQKVIENLRGTIHRLMKPRTRDSLLAPAMLHAATEDEEPGAALPPPAVDKQPLIKETFGFRLELGRASALTDVSLNLYDYTDHYKTKFSGKPQYTFVGYLGSGTSEPTIISVLQEPQTTKFPEPTFFGLVRTKSSGQDEFFILESDLLAFVASNKLQKKKLNLQMLQHLQANFFRGAKLFYVEDARIQPFLLKFEEQDPERSLAFAFAVTYAGPNDKTAIDMFNHKDGSPEFGEFLHLLGDRIELKGWSRFRGGLDVVHNTKGMHSIFTTFSNFEIMFHVSTLLRFDPADPLKLVRARQVQNDVVMVIFRDGEASSLEPYDPLVMPTNVTHVFIIVAPTRINGVLHYKVAVASKSNVTSFRPDLPLPAVFKADASFRTFLLTKLVNAQIATRKSGLHLMFTRPRAAMLNDLVQRFLTAKERQEIEREEATIPG